MQYCLRTSRIAEFKTELRRYGYHWYTIPGGTVATPETLIEALSLSLPTGDTWELTPFHWDRTADYLWQALVSSGHDRVAVLWENTEHLLERNPPLLIDLVEALAALARSLETENRDTAPQVTLLVVYLSELSSFSEELPNVFATW